MDRSRCPHQNAEGADFGSTAVLLRTTLAFWSRSRSKWLGGQAWVAGHSATGARSWSGVLRWWLPASALAGTDGSWEVRRRYILKSPGALPANDHSHTTWSHLSILPYPESVTCRFHLNRSPLDHRAGGFVVLPRAVYLVRWYAGRPGLSGLRRRPFMACDWGGRLPDCWARSLFGYMWYGCGSQVRTYDDTTGLKR